jgi:hypothetical protein
MEISVERNVLSRIWEQLNSPHRPGRKDGRRTAHEEVISEGWGSAVDIQDILWETDDRADMLARHNDDFDALREAYHLHYTSRFRGPFTRVGEVYGHEAMQACDIAMFVMEIERLGFTVDAEPLVEALRPGLLRRRYLTNSELSVVWHKKQRHRCAAMVLRVPHSAPTEATSIQTNSGYLATALFERGRPVALRVASPKSKLDIPVDYWTMGEMSRTSRVLTP